MRRRREVRQENHKILMTFSTPSQRHRSRLNFTNPRSPPWQTSQQKHNNFIYLNFTHNKTTLCDFVTDILEIYPCDVTHTAGVHTNTPTHAATAADSHWQCWPEKSVGSRKRVSNIVLNNFSSCCSLSSSLQDRGEGVPTGRSSLAHFFLAAAIPAPVVRCRNCQGVHWTDRGTVTGREIVKRFKKGSNIFSNLSKLKQNEINLKL